jgi:predicted secreted protein
VTLFGGLVVFTMAWWVFFFMALPFGAKPSAEPGKGHAASAPARPRLLLKALVTTLLAAAFTGGLAYLLESGLVDLAPRPDWSKR